MTRLSGWALLLIVALIVGAHAAEKPAQPDNADAPAKPKVAVFPLTGSADDKLRERVGFSLRMKLNRDATYEAIDGPTMKDLADESRTPINFDTADAAMKTLAADSGAAVLVWGQLDAGFGQLGQLHLKVLDLRQADPVAIEITKNLNEPTDVRFAVEEILKVLPGVKDFSHPSEEAVHHTPQTDAAWAKNRNLVVNGDFKMNGHWSGIYQADKWDIKFTEQLPRADGVVINTMPAVDDSDKSGNAPRMLAMDLSKTCAENNGLACLSDEIAIQPKIKYRLQYRYFSEGPNTHVFIKGYTKGKDLAGKDALREAYRCQVPPAGGTDGKWVTVECDCNPQNTQHEITVLKIDLYAYLKPGKIMFADVILKEVGPQTDSDQLKDDGIKPATQPAD